MTPPAPRDRPGRGILLMLAAVSAFSVMTALVKSADRIPAGEVVFFRSIVIVPVLLLAYGLTGRLHRLGTRNWRGHAWRGLVGTLAMALSFAGLRYLPLPEVTALSFATPVLIVIFAAVMLGERVRLVRISAVAAGLIGVLVILLPQLGAAGTPGAALGAGLTLAAAACAALAQIFVKRMSGTERPEAIVFWFSATAAALGLASVPFGWVMPGPAEWALLLGAGAIGGGAQLLITASYRYAEVGVLAPFTYVSMIWAIAIGWAVFAEVPTGQTLAGAALIIAAGIVIVLRERQLGLQRAAEAKLRNKAFR